MSLVNLEKGSLPFVLLVSQFLVSSFVDGPWSRGSSHLPPVLAFNFHRKTGSVLPTLAGGRDVPNKQSSQLLFPAKFSSTVVRLMVETIAPH